MECEECGNYTRKNNALCFACYYNRIKHETKNYYDYHEIKPYIYEE